MGCCESTITEQKKQMITKELKLCIQSNSISRLKALCNSFLKNSLKNLSVNAFRFKCLKGKYLNLPAYCLLLNKLEIFKFFHHNYKIDFVLMEKILREYDTSGITEICSNNYVEFLEFYLPYSLNIDQDRQSIFSSITLDLQDRDNSKEKVSYSPIQLACEKGYIPIINIIYKYFENTSPPQFLDINARDFTTGENCALIACKTCNYPMIRFLHTNCGADFKVLNNKNESAIQILAFSSKQKYNPELYNSLVYLVEKIGVDILHGYEETLLILENSDCISYFEQQLFIRQVFVSKTEIEYYNRLIKRNSEEGNSKDIIIDKNSLASSIEPFPLHFSSLTDVMSMFNK